MKLHVPRPRASVRPTMRDLHQSPLGSGAPSGARGSCLDGEALWHGRQSLCNDPRCGAPDLRQRICDHRWCFYTPRASTSAGTRHRCVGILAQHPDNQCQRRNVDGHAPVIDRLAPGKPDVFAHHAVELSVRNPAVCSESPQAADAVKRKYRCVLPIPPVARVSLSRPTARLRLHATRLCRFQETQVDCGIELRACMPPPFSMF